MLGKPITRRESNDGQSNTSTSLFSRPTRNNTGVMRNVCKAEWDCALCPQIAALARRASCLVFLNKPSCHLPCKTDTVMLKFKNLDGLKNFSADSFKPVEDAMGKIGTVKKQNFVHDTL